MMHGKQSVKEYDNLVPAYLILNVTKYLFFENWSFQSVDVKDSSVVGY